jgi:hypothetical protein
VYTHGKSDKALEVVTRLHQDKNNSTHEFAKQEFNIMSAQIDLETERKLSTWNALKIPSVRKRFILGFLTMLGTQCSGLIVILSTYSTGTWWYMKLTDLPLKHTPPLYTPVSDSALS